MVQDTSPSPEVYLSSLQGGKCGGWGLAEDTVDENGKPDIDYDKLKDRNVLWAVSIPGQSEWCFHETSEEMDPAGKLTGFQRLASL